DVEDRLECPGPDVVAQELGTTIRDVELGGLGRAEVPALTGVPRKSAGRIEEGTAVLDAAGHLVVAEKSRADPSQAEEDEHGVAAPVVVRVAPRTGDRDHAIRAAAVVGVGETDPFRVVRRGKSEPTPGGQKTLDPCGRPRWPDRGAVGLFEEATGRLVMGRRHGKRGPANGGKGQDEPRAYSGG